MVGREAGRCAASLATISWTLSVMNSMARGRRSSCGAKSFQCSPTSWRIAIGWSPSRNSSNTCYHQALALTEELGMRPLQAHCHLGLGTLYATPGRPEPARAALAAAIALYRAMDMTLWLPQAEAALAQVA